MEVFYVKKSSNLFIRKKQIIVHQISDIPVISYEDIQDTDYEIILSTNEYEIIEIDGEFYYFYL